MGIELVGSAIDNYGVEGIIDTDSENESEGRPILSSLSLRLSDGCKDVWVGHLSLTSLTENHGEEHYLKSETRCQIFDCRLGLWKAANQSLLCYLLRGQRQENWQDHDQSSMVCPHDF